MMTAILHPASGSPSLFRADPKMRSADGSTVARRFYTRVETILLTRVAWIRSPRARRRSGRIARSAAKKLAGFDVRVLLYDPYVKENRVGQAEKTSLETLLRTSDYLCVHAPLTERTRHLLNAETLGWMKPGAAVVNAARGELIDTP